ncbi:hypothetical protein EC988_005934, partial [Linderina pennispora]
HAGVGWIRLWCPAEPAGYGRKRPSIRRGAGQQLGYTSPEIRRFQLWQCCWRWRICDGPIGQWLKRVQHQPGSSHCPASYPSQAL